MSVEIKKILEDIEEAARRKNNLNQADTARALWGAVNIFERSNSLPKYLDNTSVVPEKTGVPVLPTTQNEQLVEDSNSSIHIPSDIPHSIRSFRRESHMSQERLAEESGLHVSTIKTLETTDSPNPRISTLNAIARATGRKMKIIFLKNE